MTERHAPQAVVSALLSLLFPMGAIALGGPAPADAGPTEPGAPAALDGAVNAALGDIRAGAAASQIGKRISAEKAGPAQGPTFRILSWNVQVFGKGMKPKRKEAYQKLLEHSFSNNRNVRVLAIQEVVNADMARYIDGMMPGPDNRWEPSMDDSKDSQDNLFFVRNDVAMDCDHPLFSGSGSREKSLHPARVAHMRAGDFDYTIITLHLTFGHGSPDGSRRELRHVLDWAQQYLRKSDSDPDLIIVGDFNLPTAAGKEESLRSKEKGWHPIDGIIGEYPAFRRDADAEGNRKPKNTELVPLVDDRTSRNKGEPANNYDHFIVTGDLFDEEYVQGSAGVVPPNFIESIQSKEHVLMSDHYPISAGFRMSGTGNDGRPIRLDGAAAACAP